MIGPTFSERAEAHPRWGRLLLALCLGCWMFIGWVGLVVL